MDQGTCFHLPIWLASGFSTAAINGTFHLSLLVPSSVFASHVKCESTVEKGIKDGPKTGRSACPVTSVNRWLLDDLKVKVNAE